MYDWITSVDKNELTKMGKEGIGIIESQYSTEIVTQKYVDLVNSLI